MDDPVLDRRALLAATGGALLAGCLDGDAGGSRNVAEDETPTGTATESVETPGDGNGDEPDTDTEFPDVDPDDAPFPAAQPSVPLAFSRGEYLDAVQSGGVSQDGIPSIDEPTHLDVEEGDDVLDSGDPVFGVVRNGTARAYPQHVLVWHEIVNDELGGDPVAVTYCPLTGTAQGFERGDTTFGVSGRLLNSNLIMYDRESESWWPQMLRVGIDGPLAGLELSEFRLIWTTWERWRDAHPETTVLGEDTGYARNYDSDPYGTYNPDGGYYTDDDQVMFSPMIEDETLGAKEVVIGSRSEDGAVAFEKARLRDEHVLTATTGDVSRVGVYEPTLDTGYVYRNPDGLSIERDGDGYVVDGETAAADELPLDRALSMDAMWFAWYGYFPETELGSP